MTTTLILWIIVLCETDLLFNKLYLQIYSLLQICYTDLIDILYNNILSCFYQINTNPVLTIVFRNKIIW